MSGAPGWKATIGVLVLVSACGNDREAPGTDGGLLDGSGGEVDAAPDACQRNVTVTVMFTLSGNGAGTSPLDATVGRAQTLVATLTGWTEVYSATGNNITAVVPATVSLDFDGPDAAVFETELAGAAPSGPLGGAFDETIFVTPAGDTRATLDVAKTQLSFNAHCFDVVLTTDGQGHVVLAPFMSPAADCNVQIFDQRTGSRFFQTPAGAPMTVTIERCD